MFKITEEKEIEVVYNRSEERDGQEVYIQERGKEMVIRVEDEYGNHTYISGHMLSPRLRPTAWSKKKKNFGYTTYREMYFLFRIGCSYGYYYTGSMEVYEGYPDEHQDFDYYELT